MIQVKGTNKNELLDPEGVSKLILRQLNHNYWAKMI